MIKQPGTASGADLRQLNKAGLAPVAAGGNRLCIGRGPERVEYCFTINIFHQIQHHFQLAIVYIHRKIFYFYDALFDF